MFDNPDLGDVWILFSHYSLFTFVILLKSLLEKSASSDFEITMIPFRFFIFILVYTHFTLTIDGKNKAKLVPWTEKNKAENWKGGEKDESVVIVVYTRQPHSNRPPPTTKKKILRWCAALGKPLAPSITKTHKFPSPTHLSSTRFSLYTASSWLELVITFTTRDPRSFVSPNSLISVQQD